MYSCTLFLMDFKLHPHDLRLHRRPHRYSKRYEQSVVPRRTRRRSSKPTRITAKVGPVMAWHPGRGCKDPPLPRRKMTSGKLLRRKRRLKSDVQLHPLHHRARGVEDLGKQMLLPYRPHRLPRPRPVQNLQRVLASQRNPLSLNHRELRRPPAQIRKSIQAQIRGRRILTNNLNNHNVPDRRSRFNLVSLKLL